MTGYKSPPKEHQLKPGKPGKGRCPKGGRNKLSEAFFDALLEDWLVHGKDVIEKVRVQDPLAFVKIIASLIPRNFEVSTSPFDGMSDEELEVRIREINEELGDYFANMDDKGRA